MQTLFIYQFNSPDGGKESISIEDHDLTPEEIEEIRPAETELEQCVVCKVLAGDADLLPRERKLEHL